MAPPALPDPDRLIGEAELYDQFIQGLAVEHAKFMEKHIDVFMETSPLTHKDNNNPILESWHAYFESDPATNKI